MIENAIADSPKELAGTAGRRDALRSLGAAGMALLAAVGLAEGSQARKGKNRDGKGRNKHQRNHHGSAPDPAAHEGTAPAPIC